MTYLATNTTQANTQMKASEYFSSLQDGKDDVMVKNAVLPTT
jgi:hypothetical protein